MDNLSSIIQLTGPQESTGSPVKPPGLGSNGLPMGARLREFEIAGLIGEGGFGVVYLANDHVLKRQVALKEFIPSSLAERTPGMTVAARPGQQELFQLGLKSFVNEARLLAQFDHPSLVRVYQFWEGNGTAYMVMPFYRGPTLRLWLKKRRAESDDQPPDEQWLRNLLMPLLDALETIHAAQCYHRDIAPDNIILLEGTGRPLLLDFGSARRVIGDVTQALTAFVKPGFAPIEQYAQDDSMRQGPWTDIYALAATLYFAITGELPINSTTRMLSDSMTPLSKRMKGRYSDAFLQAIDRGLAVRPEHRVQNIATWRALIDSPLDIADPMLDLARSGPQPLLTTARFPGEALAGAATMRGRFAADAADPSAPAHEAEADHSGTGVAGTDPYAGAPAHHSLSGAHDDLAQPGADEGAGWSLPPAEERSIPPSGPKAATPDTLESRLSRDDVAPAADGPRSSRRDDRTTLALIRALFAVAALLVVASVWYGLHEQRHSAPRAAQTADPAAQSPDGMQDGNAETALPAGVAPGSAQAGATENGAATNQSPGQPPAVRSCDDILKRAIRGERINEQDLRYLEQHCGE